MHNGDQKQNRSLAKKSQRYVGLTQSHVCGSLCDRLGQGAHTVLHKKIPLQKRCQVPYEEVKGNV